MSSSKQKKQHLKYTSPRCELENDELFLPSETLRDPEERWRHMMTQAGDHQQVSSKLDLTSRQQQMTPATLKVGVPPLVASRVRELHVDFHDSFSLPEWLDVVCSLFFSLQHLYTSCPPETLASEQARMRRLYILYRLPDLQSIDGKNVTLVERQLARPSSPNGYKVNRHDWVVSDDEASSNVSEDDSSVLLSHGDAVEVSLYGVVKRVSADPPKESWEEPELPKPFEAKETTRIAITTSHTASMERAHRSMSKSTSNNNAADVKTPTSSCGGLMAAAFADGGCVGSRRTMDDEPHTVDYPTSPKQQQHQQYGNKDKYAVPSNVLRGDGNNRKGGRGSGSKTGTQKKQLSREADSLQKKNMNISTTPERIGLQQQRPTTPEAKTSPSASLSSPFPMQFRSKSFNGALPSRNTTQTRENLPRKMSSPDLSPQKKNKGTIDVVSQQNSSITRTTPASPKSRASRAAERPPPCPPGAARRVVSAAEQPKKAKGRRSWRSKNAIRSTSIVDDFDDDDDDDDECMSEDEDVIEHA